MKKFTIVILISAAAAFALMVVCSIGVVAGIALVTHNTKSIPQITAASSPPQESQIQEDARALAALNAAKEEQLRLEKLREDTERQRLAQLQADREATVKSYASQYARSMMTKAFDGGQNLAVEVSKWSVMGDKFEIEMKLSFDGNFDNTNHYYVAGGLTVNQDGSSPEFSQTAVNDTARDYLILKGGVEVLNKLNEKQ